jgi:uncharacterized protein (TIGR02271 family)
MERFMDRTIVAVFDSKEHARMARDELVSLGIPESQVHLRDGTADHRQDAGERGPAFTSEGDLSRRPGFFARLFGLDDDLEDDDDLRGGYDEAVRRGSCIVAVDRVSDDSVDRASQALSRHGAIDIDERVAGWRERGWQGYDAKAPRLRDDELRRERELDAARCNVRTGAEADAAKARGGSVGQPDGRTAAIPVIEEQLEVGKRVVRRGAVRVYTRVVEQPVEAQVTLREERAHVERHPVDREATQAEVGAAFKERSIDIEERAEQPVVQKTARVVEEVEVGKRTNEHTETVRDTVRRSQVDVEEVPASRPADRERRPGTRR